MKRSITTLFALAVLAALPAKAWAVPIVDGFWDPENGDGYTITQNNYFFDNTHTANGTIGTFRGTDPNLPGHDILYMMFTQPLTVVDNSYGDATKGGGSIGWGNKGDNHKFGDLTGSDQAEILIQIGGTPCTAKGQAGCYSADIDYITADPSKGGAGNFVSLGLSGGDGSTPSGFGTQFNAFPAGSLVAAATSMQWNMGGAVAGSAGHNNGSCYAQEATSYTAIQTDSPNSGITTGQPAPQPNPSFNNDGYGNKTTMDPCPTGTASVLPAGYTTNVDWLFHVVYEVEIDLTALTGAASGTIVNVGFNDAPVVHDSPAKLTVSTDNPCDDCNVTVPEPASLMLLGTGIIGLGTALRRRKKS